MPLQAQDHSAALRLIDTTDESEGGSGVAVKIGERFFVATAEHIMKPNHRYEIAPRPAEGRIREFAARGCDPEADVAFLEVRAGDARGMENRFWPDTRLLESVDQHEEWPVVMVGYPGQFLKPIAERWSGTQVERTVRCDAFTYMTATLRDADWPAGPFERGPVAERDIFLHYDPEHQLHPLRPDTVGSPPPSIRSAPPPLKGVSGCGIWLPAHVTSPIWQPQAFLVGIQVSYFPTQKWIRGTFIRHWLNLIARNYPDLSSEIASVRAMAAENLRTMRPMVLASRVAP